MATNASPLSPNGGRQTHRDNDGYGGGRSSKSHRHFDRQPARGSELATHVAPRARPDRVYSEAEPPAAEANRSRQVPGSAPSAEAES